MKPINALSSLLLLFIFLFNEAQGIRLGNGLLEKAVLEKKIPLAAEGFTKTTLQKYEDSNSGNNRKLLMATSPSSPSPSTTRNEDQGKDNLENNNNNNSEVGSVNSENIEAEVDEHYPDIAEMDYSPAKRKPPIHN